MSRWSQGLGGSPTSYDDAEQAYSPALEPLAVGVFDADVPGAYNSHFKTMANQQEGMYVCVSVGPWGLWELGMHVLKRVLSIICRTL